MKATKLSGDIEWNGDEGEIIRAILRDNGEFVIDCTYEGARYDVRLNKAGDDYYRGAFKATEGNHTWTGSVTCRIWHSGDDLLARGDWQEDSNKFTWTAELQQIEK